MKWKVIYKCVCACVFVFVVIEILLCFCLKSGNFYFTCLSLRCRTIFLHWNITYSVCACVRRYVDVGVGVVLVVQMGVYL